MTPLIIAALTWLGELEGWEGWLGMEEGLVDHCFSPSVVFWLVWAELNWRTFDGVAHFVVVLRGGCVLLCSFG